MVREKRKISNRDNCSKTSGSLWQYYRDEPNASFTESGSFKFKARITGSSPDDNNVEIMLKHFKIALPLKYLERTLEMLLINREINLILTWSENCATSFATRKITFAITDTKLYVPIVTLSTQDNAKLLEQLKSSFKRTIN